MFLIITYLLILVATAIHILLNKKNRTTNGVIEILLMYTLFFGVGFGGIYAFIGHTFFADQVANYIGWPAHNPFQHEVAVANLGYGIAGLFAIKWRDHFWLALIIYYGVFSLGATYIHIQQNLIYKNTMPGNIGLPLILDIAEPALIFILFILYKKSASQLKAQF